MAAVLLTAVALLPVWALAAALLLVFALAVAAVDCTCASPRYSLAGKTVVITGGSSGIGLACAVGAAARGANVVLLARRPAALASALATVRAAAGARGAGAASSQICDVTDEAATAAAFAAAAAAHGGRIDVVIASAGESQPRRLEDASAVEFEAVLRLNVVGVRNSVAAALPHMCGRSPAVPRADGGRIVLVSSQAGQAGLFGYTAYSASKFALHGFAQALAQELHRRRIRVCQVFPPDTDTPLLAAENLQKPAVTRLLSEATATVSPQAVAAATLDGLERGDPAIAVGFDGWMLATLTPGMGPAGSLATALVQASTMGLWRLVGLAYVWHWYAGIIDKHDEDPWATAAAAGSTVDGRGKPAAASVLGQPLVDEDQKMK